MTTNKNLIRTNSKEYKQRIESYLLEAIDLTPYDAPEELTPRQKIEYFFSTFDREYNYPNNRKRYPNNQDRLANWLMGLPSVINIPFANWEILELAKKLHGAKELTEKEEDTILDNYWNHMAFHLIRLHDKLTK